MKVEINENTTQGEVKYPCLMKYTGSEYLLILFIADKCGSVVYTDSNKWVIGEYDTNWDINHFTPFNGSITLSND